MIFFRQVNPQIESTHKAVALASVSELRDLLNKAQEKQNGVGCVHSGEEFDLTATSLKKGIQGCLDHYICNIVVVNRSTQKSFRVVRTLPVNSRNLKNWLTSMEASDGPLTPENVLEILKGEVVPA